MTRFMPWLSSTAIFANSMYFSCSVPLWGGGGGHKLKGRGVPKFADYTNRLFAWLRHVFMHSSYTCNDVLQISKLSGF